MSLAGICVKINNKTIYTSFLLIELKKIHSHEYVNCNANVDITYVSF